MKKKNEWKFKEINKNTFDTLKQSMPNVSDHIISLFAIRNIKTRKEAENFINPNIENLYDPYLMSDMDKATYRIKEAIEKNESILIYGDYDVDGTTSVAMLWEFLNYLHLQKWNDKKKNNLSFYIPNRFKEGYGVSQNAIQKAIDESIDLIITVDCGIKDVTSIQKAEDSAIDVIVCDHHEPGEVLPDCYAILNPKKEICSYPFKDLSGCGVAFKLIQALLIAFKLPNEKAFEYLDYVVISTVADVVSLTGENRILAWKGLEKINNNPAAFVKALSHPDVLSSNNMITAIDIGFKIAPLINAAGRMEDAKTAVEFFIAAPSKRKEILEELVQLNKERREIDKSISLEANAILKKHPIHADNKSIVLYSKDWHIGTVGIVASRMIDRYYKPTFILTEIDKDIYSGSGRSIPGLNLVEVLEKQADKLLSFGGHYFAAGLRIHADNLESFAETFEADVDLLLKEEDMVPNLDIDVKIELGKITDSLANTLKRFEPCGQDNPSPIFASEKIPMRNIHYELIKEEHLKLFIKTPGENTVSKRLVAMGFNLAEDFKQLQLTKDDYIDIAYAITENVYKSQKSTQLRIIDIKKSQ